MQNRLVDRKALLQERVIAGARVTPAHSSNGVLTMISASALPLIADTLVKRFQSESRYKSHRCQSIHTISRFSLQFHDKEIYSDASYEDTCSRPHFAHWC